ECVEPSVLADLRVSENLSAGHVCSNGNFIRGVQDLFTRTLIDFIGDSAGLSVEQDAEAALEVELSLLIGQLDRRVVVSWGTDSDVYGCFFVGISLDRFRTVVAPAVFTSRQRTRHAHGDFIAVLAVEAFRGEARELVENVKFFFEQVRSCFKDDFVVSQLVFHVNQSVFLLWSAIDATFHDMMAGYLQRVARHMDWTPLALRLRIAAAVAAGSVRSSLGFSPPRGGS